MTTSDQATPGQQASRSNLRDVADTLTAYLAIPVILLYPFGFLALFLQFTRYFGLDFYTAWYAASLVNRMVAIGLGATILVAALLGSALLAGNVGQSLLLRKDQAREDQAGSRTFWRRTLLIVRLGIVPFLVLLYTSCTAGYWPLAGCMARVSPVGSRSISA
jgi:hypothetical protein